MRYQWRLLASPHCHRCQWKLWPSQSCTHSHTVRKPNLAPCLQELPVLHHASRSETTSLVAQRIYRDMLRSSEHLQPNAQHALLTQTGWMQCSKPHRLCEASHLVSMMAYMHGCVEFGLHHLQQARAHMCLHKAIYLFRTVFAAGISADSHHVAVSTICNGQHLLPMCHKS